MSTSLELTMPWLAAAEKATVSLERATRKQ
jgi:hypothetical protein